MSDSNLPPFENILEHFDDSELRQLSDRLEIVIKSCYTLANAVERIQIKDAAIQDAQEAIKWRNYIRKKVGEL